MRFIPQFSPRPENRVSPKLVIHARRNPLVIDPTRTTLLRKLFMNDMKRRFAKLKEAIRDFMVGQDALGLKERKLGFTQNVQPRQYQFLTDADKLKAFNEWFRQQVEAGVFSVKLGAPGDDPWTAEYVESAYRRGVVNAFLASKQGKLLSDEVGAQSAEQFVKTAFAQPETISKVRLLATRSFEQLKGVTATMGSQMNRILAQGIADGKSVTTLAKQMTDSIDGLTRSRALLIARTEIINAHAEGQLDSFKKLGIEQLGVKAEWSTAGDLRVCPQCSAMEGKVFTIKEARGMIPLHPGCRCSWIPSL